MEGNLFIVIYTNLIATHLKILVEGTWNGANYKIPPGDLFARSENMTKKPAGLFMGNLKYSCLIWVGLLFPLPLMKSDYSFDGIRK